MVIHWPPSPRQAHPSTAPVSQYQCYKLLAEMEHIMKIADFGQVARRANNKKPKQQHCGQNLGLQLHKNYIIAIMVQPVENEQGYLEKFVLGRFRG